MWEYLQRTGDYQKWFGHLRASRYMDFPFEVSNRNNVAVQRALPVLSISGVEAARYSPE